MRSSRLAVGLVGLAIVALWYSVGGARQLPATRAADAPPRVTAPLTHENLSVYFVHGPDAVADAKVMSLQEALDRELAVVHETGTVNVLAIENRSSEYDLFVQSNDIVKGGKQDRVIQADVLLPPRSGVVPLRVNCVEQGRWTGRGAEDAKRFASSAKCAAGKAVKYANASGEQAAVWQGVRRTQAELQRQTGGTVAAEASPTSFQLTLESPAVAAKVAEYESALRAAGADRDGVIGVVFAVNGQISGAEVYGSGALFRKAWPKLLNAAAVEAVMDRSDAPTTPPPSAREIERFLAYGADPEPTGAGAVAGSPLVSTEDPVANRLQPLNRSNRRGGANANEEIYQTEGRPPGGEVIQTEGRAPVRPAGPQPANPARPLVALAGAQAELPAPPAPNRMGLDFANARDAEPAPQTANRLNSNRTENRSTLVVESRDPARQNAVIHRSYLKK